MKKILDDNNEEPDIFDQVEKESKKEDSAKSETKSGLTTENIVDLIEGSIKRNKILSSENIIDLVNGAISRIPKPEPQKVIERIVEKVKEVKVDNKTNIPTVLEDKEARKKLEELKTSVSNIEQALPLLGGSGVIGLPTMYGKSGKYLTTDGNNPSWVDVTASTSTYSQYLTATTDYVTLLGETPSDIYRIDQFFRALEDAGLDTSLVDGCFMRTTQNLSSGTSLKSIRGATATLVGTPSIGAKGMVLDGSTQYGTWAVTSTKTGTASVNFKGVTSGQTSSATILCLQNSSGWSSGAGTGTNIQMICNGTSTGYVFTGESGSVAVTDSWYEGTFSSLTLHPANPYEINYMVSNDNAASPTIKMYCNGQLIVTDSTGNVQSTGNRDEMVIGCRRGNGGVGGAGNFAKGTYTHWFLFNKVLSTTEAAAFHAACRWLDPRTKNKVYLGDSTSAWFFTKSTDSWPYQYEHMIGPSSAWHVNLGINGYSASTLNGLYDTRVKPFRPGVNGVEQADLNIWLGINDINTGSTDSQVYTTLKALWAKAKNDGFTVHVMTLMPGATYTVTTDGYRTALNTSILSDQSLYDTYLRADRLFPDKNDTTYYLDGYHLLTLGNTIIANARAREEYLINIPPQAYPLIDGANIATDASLVPHGAICYVTLAGNRTLDNPTNPTAGQRLVYRFTQDGTGGRTITLGSTFRTGSYTVTLSTAPSAVNYLEVIYNLTDNKWDVVNFNTFSAGAGDMLKATYDAANIAQQVIGTTATQTLTNKTIDADLNTITNIENADIKAAAAIALNKLAATTVSRALVSDGSGFVSPATTTSTEIGYVNGVTSAIQTQLNAKQASDATLTALAAYNTNGVLTQTAADTFTGRTITGTSNQVTVTNGDGVAGNPTLSLASNALTQSIGITIDGGGSAITTGVKGYIEVPFACTINRATLLADQTGSIVIDVWKDTYANYPPTVADTITASAKPTLSTATKSQDSTLTGWTTSVSAGDILGFNVDSATTVTRVHLILKVAKS